MDLILLGRVKSPHGNIVYAVLEFSWIDIKIKFLINFNFVLITFIRCNKFKHRLIATLIL